MISVEYCQLLARYGHWMNERMFAALAPMPDEERRRDRGAFFGSIHRTLNHILWADRIWLGRLRGTGFAAPAFGADLVDRFEDLARERAETDRELLDWAGQLEPDWLAGPIEYHAASDGKLRRMPAWVAAVHLFQHGTHHRAQVGTLMKQAGVDPGVTDLPFLPGLLRTD